MEHFDQIMERFDRLEGMLVELRGKKRESPPASPEYGQFLEEYNRIFATKKRGNDKTKRQFNARIKEGFAIRDIIGAMMEARKEQIHIESNFKWLTPEFFTRSDKLDRYVPAEKKEERKRFLTYNDLQEER